MNIPGRALLRVLLHRSSARRGRTVRRGQALVEFTLFVPLMMFMIVGATDVSTLLDDHLSIVYAARAGARVGSVIGSYAPSGAPYTADCAIIGAVQAALASSRNVQVTAITIYQANSTGGITGTSEDVYAGNTVCDANGNPSPGASQTGWPPSVRSTTPFQEDSIGVAISYNYNFQFNPLAIQFNPQGKGTFSATDDAVMPIEIVVGTPPASTPPPTATP